MYAKIITLDVKEYAEVTDDDILSLYYHPKEKKFYTSDGQPITVPWEYFPFWIFEMLKYSDNDYVCMETSEGDIVEVFFPSLADEYYGWAWRDDI